MRKEAAPKATLIKLVAALTPCAPPTLSNSILWPVVTKDSQGLSTLQALQEDSCRTFLCAKYPVDRAFYRLCSSGGLQELIELEEERTGAGFWFYLAGMVDLTSHKH